MPAVKGNQEVVRVRDANSGRAPAEDDKLTGRQAAEVCGLLPGTWRDYTKPKASRGGRVFGPPADGTSQPCGCEWWYRSTVEAFRDRTR